MREVNAIKDYHWDEGLAKGIELGTAKGMEIGRSEGKAEGTRAIVGRLLERKFGPLSPKHQATLDAATIEQLEEYSEALLTSSTIDAVFGL